MPLGLLLPIISLFPLFAALVEWSLSFGRPRYPRILHLRLVTLLDVHIA
jgi:hypothetical protein